MTLTVDNEAGATAKAVEGLMERLPDADGLLHSRVFSGLRLPIAPLLAGDTAKVLAALEWQEQSATSVNSED